MKRAILAIFLTAGLAACSSSTTSELDPTIQAGRDIFSANCALCHGAGGQGAAAPALTDVVATFGDCADQVSWITIGSARHKLEVGPTYGDTGKEITGIMPSFETVLSAEQIAQVAAFERHRFGGLAETTALEQCGF